jgi:hypothetical protein
MKLGPRLAAVTVAITVFGALVCFGPYHQTRWATVIISVAKLVGLLLAALSSIGVFRTLKPGERERISWGLLAAALTLMVAGQSVLAFHQVVLDDRAPFPSLADPPYVLGEAIVVVAMVDFAWRAFRSGLPLGSPAAFWSPGVVVLVLFALTVKPVLAPVIAANSHPVELFLNVYYPVTGYLTLAPIMVVLGVGLRFQGAIRKVWVPLSLGFACILVSDIFFAYFTTLSIASLDAGLDFLYLTGYWLIPTGAITQLDLVRT